MYQLSCTDFLSLSKLEFWLFFSSFDTVLTSCEGVLWKGDEVIAGSSETLNLLRELGKRILFLTNNSMRTTDEFVKHAETLGFIAHKTEVISSSYLAAYYLQSKHFSDTVYVIGSRGLMEELDAAGIKYIGPGPDYPSETLRETCENAVIDTNVKAVIVGLDEHFSFPKILKASSYLKNPECEFIAANCEERKGGHIAKVVPAAGAILAAIETCAGRKAVILGKAGTFLGEYLRRQFCVDPPRTLFLGDRLELDVSLEMNCGFQTLLVLSGMTLEEELYRKMKLKRLNQGAGNHLPDLFTKTLGDLLRYLTLTEYKN